MLSKFSYHGNANVEVHVTIVNNRLREKLTFVPEHKLIAKIQLNPNLVPRVGRVGENSGNEVEKTLRQKADVRPNYYYYYG